MTSDDNALLWAVVMFSRTKLESSSFVPQVQCGSHENYRKVIKLKPTLLRCYLKEFMHSSK